MSRCLRIAPTDNVAVALEPVAAGIRVAVEGASVTTREDIPQGHKLALTAIPAGADVIKYGYPIGRARTEIQPGQWVHTHNLATRLDGAGAPQAQVRGGAPAPLRPRSFQGYRRADGRVGIRNELWIVPTVGCVNGVARSMARRVEDYARGRVDGVHVWFHPYGCSQMGEDQEHTRAILCGLIRHPNAGAVLVLGLGCENSSIAVLQERLGRWDSQRVAFLECQAVEDELAEGERLLRELADRAAADRREPVGADELVVGLKCGGSDGLSGITANPLAGRVTDRVIAMGGSALLAEVPEMFGAETLLMNRCATPELFEKTVNLINGFKDYFTSHNQTIYENPSPGNKKGGISTLEDKSLGCTQKSGSSLVKGVLEYAEPVKVKGLNLLSAPGNDLVAATALAVSGAHMVLFTTGRGTPFASPVPTVKISSNSKLAGHKSNWIDFNAGQMVEDKTKEELAQDLLNYVLEVASGRKVKSEAAGFHDMAIFKQGVTL